MATPRIENPGVISEQPKPSIGFDNALVTSTIPEVPILGIFTPLTYVVLKHSKGAGCCGAVVQYILQGPNNETLLQGGEKYTCRCTCNQGLTPVVIQDLQGTEILQVKVQKSPGCFSTTMEVEISAPPGNPIGAIHIDGLTYGSASNVSEIISIPTGRKVFVGHNKNSSGNSEFLFSVDRDGYNVGVMQHERTPWRYVLQIADINLDPITKANLLGFMIMLDIIKLVELAQQRFAEARQQRRGSDDDGDYVGYDGGYDHGGGGGGGGGGDGGDGGGD